MLGFVTRKVYTFLHSPKPEFWNDAAPMALSLGIKISDSKFKPGAKGKESVLLSSPRNLIFKCTSSLGLGGSPGQDTKDVLSSVFRVQRIKPGMIVLETYCP